ncbi:glycosyltransferase [Candidatus Gracilibacteria bacterium]|nr:glycosyltransferase [Candidatus Gracilibacteria bacterium]
MKIGIDARICDEDGYYGQYVWELILTFCKKNIQHDIIVYRNHGVDKDIEKTEFMTCDITRTQSMGDGKIKKIFQKEKFGMMIFFDHHIPHGYKGNFLVLIESLKEVFFPKKKYFARRNYQHKLQRAIKHSERVLVMDGGSALELNESLDVSEDKIEKIHGFFPKVINSNVGENRVDIAAKHNLRGKYLIYDSGNEMHNNFDRILKTMNKLKEKEVLLYLIILCDETNKDIDVRSKSIEYDISEQIIFLGAVDASIEKSYYTQSAGVVFSSIYESFPFHFSKALNYGVPIFANDIPANKEVMGDTITYLDPLSIHNITDTLAQKLSFPETPDYSGIRDKFSAKNSARELVKILELKN